MTRDGSTDEATLRDSFPGLREFFRTFIIGICMGSADAVPGVSGGTIALIAGIYGRLIAMITAITPERLWNLVRALVPFDGRVSVEDALNVWDEIDGWFGVSLLAGIGIAVVIVTRIVHIASRDYPTLLFGFFFGLIAASAVVLSGSGTLLRGGGIIVIFVSGAIAVSAMILPGISGSLLLVILGQYTRMSTALSRFVDAVVGVVTGGSSGQLVDYGAVVVTFVLGGIVGLFTVSRVVRRSLDRNRRATMAFLVALVVGALRAPVERVQTEVGFSSGVVVAFAGAAVVGAVFLLVLDWYAVDLDIDTV
ncbi:MAG: DUF368 domain-containing protein [Halobacteria archaeon]|nr:DUF368 domain-containing protein [Halobacteria archaeon]